MLLVGYIFREKCATLAPEMRSKESRYRSSCGGTVGTAEQSFVGEFTHDSRMLISQRQGIGKARGGSTSEAVMTFYAHSELPN